jgi:hypothetical protein
LGERKVGKGLDEYRENRAAGFDERSRDVINWG